MNDELFLFLSFDSKDYVWFHKNNIIIINYLRRIDNDIPSEYYLN